MDATRPSNDQSDALFRAVRGRLATIVVLSLIGAVASVVPFIAIVELANTLWPAVSGGTVDESRAWWIAGVAGVALVVGFVASSASAVVGHLADDDLQLDLRRRIVSKLRSLPLGWFDDGSSGTVRKVAENDVSALHQLIAHAIQDLVRAVTIPLLSLAYLFVVEWRMALACVVPIVVAAATYTVLMRDGDEKYAEYNASVARLNAAAIEYVHGIAVVKSFGQAGRSHQRYRDETGRFVRTWSDWAAQSGAGMALIELVTSPVTVLVFLSAVGTWLVEMGTIAPLDVLPALLLGIGLTAPFLQLAFAGQFMRLGLQARGSLTEFLAQEPVPQPTAGSMPAGATAAFDAVSFSYDGEHHVLDDISATCAPGTVTALVGPSGSGKSTLARLLPRFYDVTTGVVSIGNVDVRDAEEDNLYQQVGFVFQDAYLLRTTIRDNIRLTRPEADQGEVERAARAAQIHDRILRLPRGYDSVIGDDAHLSGGEAQRLTIARALLTDAPILVLDEATAFADPDSEAAIQAALSELTRERTLLVIAHRLHTIAGADQILVLYDGRIAENGRHDELIGADGHYREMWDRYRAARSDLSAVDTAVVAG